MVERFVQVNGNSGSIDNNSKGVWGVEIIDDMYYISYCGHQICYGSVEAGMSCVDILRMCSGKEYLRVS